MDPLISSGYLSYWFISRFHQSLWFIPENCLELNCNIAFYMPIAQKRSKPTPDPSCLPGRVTMNESPFWSITVPRLMSSYAFIAFAILWVGFVIALILNPAWLDALWDGVGALPSALNILAWVFLTPIMTALWIWESSWSTLVRLLGFAGIAGWTALAVSSFLKAWRKT